MILRTERLVLRPLEEKDAPEIFILRSDPRAIQFTDIQAIERVEDALPHIEMIREKRQNGSIFHWCMSLEEAASLVGIIGLFEFSEDRKTAEIGFAVLPDFFGKGYASESVAEVLRFGFETLQLDAITAFSNPKNVASQRVLEKFGFEKIGMEEKYEIFRLEKNLEIKR